MCIFKLCAAISQDLGLLEIGPLYCKHTQLNVCEKEELPCFLYLMKIFALDITARFAVIEKEEQEAMPF